MVNKTSQVPLSFLSVSGGSRLTCQCCGKELSTWIKVAYLIPDSERKLLYINHCINYMYSLLQAYIHKFTLNIYKLNQHLSS